MTLELVVAGLFGFAVVGLFGYQLDLILQELKRIRAALEKH
jgi:hypothetical protein